MTSRHETRAENKRSWNNLVTCRRRPRANLDGALNGQRSTHADFSTARKQTPQAGEHTARLAPTNWKRRAVYARQQTLAFTSQSDKASIQNCGPIGRTTRSLVIKYGIFNGRTNREAGAGFGKRKRHTRAEGADEITSEGEDTAEAEDTADGEDNDDENNEDGSGEGNSETERGGENCAHVDLLWSLSSLDACKGV
ncbi:hypothetical protein DVH05_021103 [Phytophthora capsici]|nr:hypothetical protein DVH05_021103 [Phytophthora capsici]